MRRLVIILGFLSVLAYVLGFGTTSDAAYVAALPAGATAYVVRLDDLPEDQADSVAARLIADGWTSTTRDRCECLYAPISR